MVNLGMEDIALLDGNSFHSHVLIFLNGLTVGVTSNADYFIS